MRARKKRGLKEFFTSESMARSVIVLVFFVMLIGFVLFLWSAQNYSARAERNTAVAAAVAEAIENRDVAMMSQLGELETQLSLARSENERLQDAHVEIIENVSLDYAGEYRCTAYCCERYPHICGGNGVTASGTVPTPGLTIAADWSVHPPGTWLYIEGVGLRRVEDSGSAIKGQRIDVAIDTHANALRWSGVGYRHVWVLNWDA